jgi:cytochrome P450
MNFFSDEVRRNPFPMYDQIRSASPVLRDPKSDIWMIFDYQGVKRVLTDHDAFSSNVSPGGLTAKWFIFADPPRHTKMRALIMRAFTPSVIANLEPRIRQLSRDLLDQHIERGEMDLAGDYAVPLPMLVIAQMLGIPAPDWPRFKRWGDAILQLSHTIAGGAEATRIAGEQFRAATDEMKTYLADLIEQRRAVPSDDLLTRLVQAEVDGERLTDEDILAFFQLLLVAGTETTTNLINNAILCLIENPDQFTRLQSATDLLAPAIEEILRYRSPVQWMFRGAKRAIEVHGQTIPAGSLILPMIGSANRDPAQFPDAARFDITRNPNPHVAFGHGIHFCLGAPLARLEGRIALGDLCKRLKKIELASSQPWEPRKALHVHGPATLPIRFESQT